MTITAREQSEVEDANASGRLPVVLVHGLWLLASSWDRWRERFQQRGYATLAPGWPNDPATVEEARRSPQRVAGTSVGQAADHYEEVLARLRRRPVVIGHSFGGLLVQIVAGRGRAAGAVAIDPAPFRGVLSLPRSALKAAAPVLRDPRNHQRAVTLTFDQFRYSFANAVPESEARAL